MRPHQPQKIREKAITSKSLVIELVRAARRVCDYTATKGGGGYAAGSGEARIGDLKLALEPFLEPDTTDEK